MALLGALREALAARGPATCPAPGPAPAALALHYVPGAAPNVVQPVYECDLPPYPFQESQVYEATVQEGTVLCPEREGYKAVYELTLDTKGFNHLNYKPGDSIGIIPKNSKEDVEILLKRLGLLDKADVVYDLRNVKDSGKSKVPKHVPVQCTLRYTFTNCVDLRAVMKKQILQALSTFTTDETEKRCMQYLCSKDGSSIYNEHVLNNRVSIIDILEIFPSCKPPVSCILSLLTRLLPRPYSIVNSRLGNKDVIKICFSVMNIAEKRKGLTTGWLEKIILTSNKSSNYSGGGLECELNKLTLNESIGKEKIPIFIRKSTKFVLPNDTSKSVILIGPGTGVAPYLGYLEERNILKKENPQIELGKAWLFFGCRNPDVDYIYKKELHYYLDNKVLTRLSEAFSRIDNIKYVQDAIKHHSKDMVESIENGASVYVCGDLSEMARQVQEVIIACIVEHTGRSDEEARNLIKNMEKEGRYLLDFWS